MTVIRGQHPVDGTTTPIWIVISENLNPSGIPDPEDFDEALAGHVVTEVFAYLARNPHEDQVFELTYRLSEPELEFGEVCHLC